MDPVHQEVDHQRVRVVRQKTVDVEQEPVENVLQDSPHEVAKDKQRNGIEKGFRGNATSLHCLDWCQRVHGERRDRVCTIRELD